jgi:hypothetical protein
MHYYVCSLSRVRGTADSTSIVQYLAVGAVCGLAVPQGKRCGMVKVYGTEHSALITDTVVVLYDYSKSKVL